MSDSTIYKHPTELRKGDVIDWETIHPHIAALTLYSNTSPIIHSFADGEWLSRLDEDADWVAVKPVKPTAQSVCEIVYRGERQKHKLTEGWYFNLASTDKYDQYIYKNSKGFWVLDDATDWIALEKFTGDINKLVRADQRD